MLQALFTSATGLAAQQQRLDTIANNLANVNTNGFKSVRTDFKDALYNEMLRPVPDDTVDLQRGVGALLSANVKDYHKGAIQNTGVNTDFYIDGEAFFQVYTKNGEIAYTRAGDFSVSREPAANYLVTKTGDYVLDENGNKISLSGDLETLSCASDGSLSMGQNSPIFAKLGVYDFPNLDGLTSLGGNYYMPTAVSGGARRTAGYEIRQGALEMSNVNMGQEMTRLIRAQRAFSLASRAVTTADNMEQTALDSRR